MPALHATHLAAAVVCSILLGVPTQSARIARAKPENHHEDTFDKDDEQSIEQTVDNRIEYANGAIGGDNDDDGSFGIKFNLSAASKGAVCSDQTSGRRVVSVADQHGDFDGMIAHLKKLGLVKSSATRSSSSWSNLWIGGNAIFVQTGDILDRGPDGKMMYKFLWRLQDSAPGSGGEVVLLTGNHELMVLQGDIRYVTNVDFCSYTKGNCGGKPPSKAEYCSTCCNYNNKICSSNPGSCMKGNCEFLSSWDKGGEMGKEMRNRFKQGKMKLAYQVSGVVFTHAGLVSSLWPKIGGSSRGVDRLNARGAALFANSSGKALWDSSDIVAASSTSNGPMWTRVCYDDWYTSASRRRSRGRWEYMSDAERKRVESSRCQSIAKSLSGISAKKMVIGHCPQGPSSKSAGVQTGCSGSLILADTYMSIAYAGSRKGATYNQAALEFFTNSADRIYIAYMGRSKCVRV